MITVGSIFSGVGGFDLAARRSGMRVLWQSEIDKQAQSVLMRHFPECRQLGDVKHVSRKTATTPDVLVGGSPCQDISRSGSRKGLAGDKSKLFWEYIRVVQECRPAIAVWENVEAALSSNAGRDFFLVVNSFRECGARDVGWRVLNSQYAGVPQRRRRVFLVADFRGQRAGEILFEPSSANGYQTQGGQTGHDIAHTLTTSHSRIGIDHTHQTYIPTIAYALTTSNQRLRGAAQETFIPTVAQPLLSKTRFAGDGDETYIPTGIEGEASETDFGVRRLTPVECERLQGFPDRWTQWGHDGREMSDTARYRMMGNAVTVNVVQWILERVVKFG